MGGFFGAISHRDCVPDVFFGTDYHSHLGTRRGGMASFSKEAGFARYIHNIEQTPFRTKFSAEMEQMHGTACIGCISDNDPQPILIRSRMGVYAISTIGLVNNAEALVDSLLHSGQSYFESMSSGRVNASELVAALINQKDSFAEGIRYAQSHIDGAASILILSEREGLIAARDRLGRLPVLIGQDDEGYAVSFESFALGKLGYRYLRDLGPGEIVRLTADGMERLAPPQEEMRVCAFLWTYYGYPNSQYEGINVEVARNRNGRLMAISDRANGKLPDVDSVCGVPDSGVPHAIGYANESHIPFARPFIKYTPTWPRSFMSAEQSARNQVAKMKMIPVHELIEGKKLLFVDDSIVRGTQLRETVDFLYDNGAKEVHMRSACPPIMFGCKYLNFSRSTSDMDLITRRTIHELEGAEGLRHLEEYIDARCERGAAMRSHICKKLKLSSLEYQSVEGAVEAIGMAPCKLCTYCWNGKE